VETLSEVAEPLGDKSLRRLFSRAWERDGEVADLARRAGFERANVVLVGESGVGKTSVLVDAARAVERNPAPDAVAREGFDARYGARPLQRALDRMVVALLARFLLDNPHLTEATIRVDLDDGGRVTFRVAGSR
jgi:ATP-dependent Clp protease ATP-binding subunit ClpA